MRNKRESGFTLLELLLVVGVGALLIIGGISTYRIVVEGSRVNDSTRLLMQIKSEAQKLYQGQSSYAGIAIETLQAVRAVPESGLTPFSTLIAVAPATTTNADDSFAITFPAIPESACMRMGRAFVDPSEVQSVDVGGTNFDQAYMRDTASDWVTDLLAACATGADITWTFR